MTPSALRGHPRVSLQLRALAATEATVADGEGRRLPVPGPPGSGTGRDSKEPIADMSAVESRENRDWRDCADLFEFRSSLQRMPKFED